eukprot:gene21967-biopygen11703
MGLGPHP